MKLGPMDTQVAAFIPVAVVFVYEKPFDFNNELIPVERLRKALAKLLDHYPHLTGRLRLHSDGSRDITSLGTGAELVEAQCNSRLDAFRSSGIDGTPRRITLPSLPGAGNALLPPFDMTLEAVCRDPLFTIQHTRFACGGVGLGIRLPHTVCDSDGYFQLVRDLAELYRGLDSGRELSHPPHLQPYLADMTQEDREAALAFKPSMFHLEPPTDPTAVVESKAEPASPSPPPPPVSGRVLRFSAHELTRLKAHATSPHNTDWVSTFDALPAHLWQRTYHARLHLLTTQGRTPSEAAATLSRSFLTSVNMRSRSRLALPPRYFPNAVITPFTSVAHETLATGPLWRVAAALHALTRSVGRAQADRTMRWFEAQADKSRVRLGFRFDEPGFMVSQWSKFDLYGGAGFDVDDARGEAVAPALVAPPFTGISLVDGLGYLLPTEEQGRGAREEGAAGVDVYLALSEPVWEVLERDGELRRFRE